MSGGQAGLAVLPVRVSLH